MPTQLRQQKFPFGSLRKGPHWSTKGLKFFSQFKPAGKLIDETANKNHGTITGPTWVGRGLVFDGSSDYVDFPSSFSNLSGKNITLTAWIKLDSHDSSGSHLFSTTNGAGNSLWWQFGTTSAVFMAGNHQVSTPGIDWADGILHHIAFVTNSNSDLIMYRDGAVVGSTNTSFDAIVTGPKDFNMGRFISGPDNWHFNGTIYSSMAYSRALLASEVLGLYINPNLLMQQYRVLGKAPAVAGVTIPVMIHHYKQAGGL